MINNIELLAFIKENLSFARTIVIKNENLALTDNAAMKAHLGIDSGNDKSKWRYYLNLNGEYHVTDTMMKIKSLDDNEIIDFTKENLEQHPATKKAYRLGGYYFSRLNSEYPAQSELIQGIINPISPEEAIPANNFQILRYTKEYVNWNETQLIPALQDDINKNVYQFYDTEYLTTDNLMVPALIAVVEKCIFEFLLQNRFENRKTRFAHPFYIWSHLQSKGISPIYKSLLNEKQTMWLFRNIDYVLRNLGKEQTFKELIDILLTERKIPLTKYDLVQSTEEMRDTLQPEPFYYSERLNLVEQKGNGQGLHKVSKIMLKEVPESLDNEDNYDEFYEATKTESTFNEFANYPIKVLDSDLVDTSNRKPETIYNVLNNELIYLAGKGLYNINLDIEEPRTGVHHRLSVKEAIVLWHHLLNKYHGSDCDRIPKFYYKDVLKITPPKLNELLNVGSKPFITSEWCKDVLKTHIPQIRMVSPSIFYENSRAIFDLKWAHQKMYSRWCSIGYYSRRKNTIQALYETGFMQLTDSKTYTDFLNKQKFDFTDYSKEDYFGLMWAIWKRMTGWDQFSHITVAQIQSGMIGLMKFLSSYSVQYVYQTLVEEGWYEGGLDLFTENPMLMSPNSDGQLELETDTTRWVPVHHRVTTDEEEEINYVENGEFEKGVVLEELTEDKLINHTPLLYDYDPDSTDGDDGVHGAYNVDMTFKLRNFTGKLPYDLEDLIPKGGNRSNEHTLKEMIVDTFEGVANAGPWVAKDIVIVNNDIDNKAVAKTVDGFEYSQIIKTESFTKDNVEMRRYYVGFIPALLESNVIKLDIVAVNKETNETVHVRFDYNIKTKQNTWAISFDIPESVILNAPFTITPTITGLNLGGENIVEENYVVLDSIKEYLAVKNENGIPTGTFLKSNWPSELPILYTILTKNSNSDDLLSRHYYYMKGLIPSDRYYDPLLDPEFEPKVKFSEGDTDAITMEIFTVAASNKGWEAVDLYIKKDSNGNLPTSSVKTDYEGIKDYLSPTLSERKYVDTVVDGKTLRSFEWLYAAAKTGITLNLILKLKNSEGDVVLKEFTYKPDIIDHGAKGTFNILPEEGFKFGIGYSTESPITINGLGEAITLKGGSSPTPVGSFDNVTLSYGINPKVEGNKVYGYVVRPNKALTSSLKWVDKVYGTVKSKNGLALTLYPYGSFTLSPSDVVDYDIIDTSEIKVKGWGTNAISASAIVPTRYAMTDFSNGWMPKSYTVVKDSKWPKWSRLHLLGPGKNYSYDYPVKSPRFSSGRLKDGTQSTPEGYNNWFTLYALADEEYLNGKDASIEIPITVSLENKYTGKKGNFVVNVTNDFVMGTFEGTKTPAKLSPAETFLVTPNWPTVPYDKFGTSANKISTVGVVIGASYYNTINGGKGKVTTSFNDDGSLNITMPDSPLGKGDGIYIYNELTYRSIDKEYAGTSLQDVVYYPRVIYTTKEIDRVPTPTFEDFNIELLPGTDFYKNASSSLIFTSDKAKVKNIEWNMSSADLEIFGTAEQDKHIMTDFVGYDLTEKLYSTSVQAAGSYHDRRFPNNSARDFILSFAPINLGKQKFTVIFTANCKTISGVDSVKYYHEIEIDVKEHYAELRLEKNWEEPWWLNGSRTFIKPIIVNPPDRVETGASYTEDSTTVLRTTSTAKDLIKVNAGSGKSYYSVDILQKFTRKDVGFIMLNFVNYSKFYYNDARKSITFPFIHYIDPSHIYDKEDITLDLIGFKPDVIWNPMNVNESYVERYLYNKLTRGWAVNTISVREDSDWMNHIFEHDGRTIKTAPLFGNEGKNETKDRTVNAPDGKLYFLPRYGGRKIGKQNVKIDIVLKSSYQYSDLTIPLTYETTRDIISSDIGFTLEYDKLYIGKRNEFKGGFTNIPSKDISEAVSAYGTTFTSLGESQGYFTPGTGPFYFIISENYDFNNAKDILAIATARYNGTKSGQTVKSGTEFRAYRGEQIIPASAVTLDPAVFDIKQLGIYWRELESTAVSLYLTQPSSGWKVKEVRFKVEEMDDYILKEYKGINTLDSAFYEPSNTISDNLENEKAVQAGLRFIPKSKGTFNYPAELTVKKGDYTLKIPFTINMEVKERLSEIGYINFYRSRNIGRLPISAEHPLIVGNYETVYGTAENYDKNYQVVESGSFGPGILGDKSLLDVSLFGSKPAYGYSFGITPQRASTNEDAYISYYHSRYDIDLYGKITNPNNITRVERAMIMDNPFNKGDIIDSGGYELRLTGKDLTSINDYYAEFSFTLYKNGSVSSDSVNRKYGAVKFSADGYGSELKTTGLNGREYTSGGGSVIDILPLTSEYPNLKESSFDWTITGVVEVTDKEGKVYPVYFYYEGKYRK